MESAGRILVVEDDVKLASQIERMLQRYHYEVLIEHRGDSASERILQWQPDVVVLDLMLPGADGFDVCRDIRAHFHGKVLMLTASEDDMDHVAALELGADDYMVKPVHPRVLLAHVRLLQRQLAAVANVTMSANVTAAAGTEFGAGSESVGAGAKESGLQAVTENSGGGNAPLVFGSLSIYPLQRRVTLASDDVVLTPSEFDVLLLLAQRAEEVVSRDDILKSLRGIEYDGFDRSVDVKVASLRKKLGDSTSQPRRFITVRARGYLFIPDAWG